MGATAELVVEDTVVFGVDALVERAEVDVTFAEGLILAEGTLADDVLGEDALVDGTPALVVAGGTLVDPGWPVEVALVEFTVEVGTHTSWTTPN